MLVLGGSVFVGRAFVVEALRLGYDVTTFNRGITGVDVPGVEAVHGDREVTADLERLELRPGMWCSSSPLVGVAW